MAEGVGFEPTRACALPVFKTGAINHSTTPPGDVDFAGSVALLRRAARWKECRARRQEIPNPKLQIPKSVARQFNMFM